jgi:ketosteroid isomerase-like protein
MSVKEIEAVVQELGSAFSRMDMKATANLFSENLEVFDHVPYRFDNKKQFVEFLTPRLQVWRSAISVSANSPVA